MMRPTINCIMIRKDWKLGATCSWLKFFMAKLRKVNCDSAEHAEHVISSTKNHDSFQSSSISTSPKIFVKVT